MSDDKIYTVVFVCTANICRTPMAEYYFNKLIAEDGLDHRIYAESAGTWAVEGMPAAENTRLVCAENGLDVSAHRSRPISPTMVKEADLILCMTEEHKNDLCHIFPQYSAKIFTLREYANHREGGSILDPYGREIVHYRQTFQQIAAEIDRIVPAVRGAAMAKFG